MTDSKSKTRRGPRQSVLLIVAGALGLCIFVAFFLLHQENGTNTCAICFSTQNFEQWRLGSFRSSIPISSAKITFVESQLSKDFAYTNHQHDWLFNGSTARYLGNRRRSEAMGSGSNAANDFAKLYESTDKFRTFLATKERAGKITREQILNMLLLERYQSKTQADNPAIDAAIKLSRSLLQEYNSN